MTWYLTKSPYTPPLVVIKPMSQRNQVLPLAQIVPLAGDVRWEKTNRIAMVHRSQRLEEEFSHFCSVMRALIYGFLVYVTHIYFFVLISHYLSDPTSPQTSNKQPHPLKLTRPPGVSQQHRIQTLHVTYKHSFLLSR